MKNVVEIQSNNEVEKKQKRAYKMSEEDREKRKVRAKELALVRAEKIKVDKDKKKVQVTYKDFFNIINDLAGSDDEKSEDEEIKIPQKPEIKTKSIKPTVQKTVKPTEHVVDENTTVIIPPKNEENKPKPQTIRDLLSQSMLERMKK